MGHFYGTEKGYDIYFYFPTEIIANNYKTMTMSPNSGKYDTHNDWSFYSKDGGMAVNLGILCIPEDVRVGKTSGSQYEFDERGNLIKEIYIDKIIQMCSDQGEVGEKIDEIISITSKCDDVFYRLSEDEQENIFSFLQKNGIKRDLITSRLLLFFTNHQYSLERVRKLFRAKDFEDKAHLQNYLKRVGKTPQEYAEEFLHKDLNTRGLLYQRAKDTVSSKEYWEKFFQENPDLKPRRIVYYPVFVEEFVPETVNHSSKTELNFKLLEESRIEYSSQELKKLRCETEEVLRIRATEWYEEVNGK